MSSVTKRGMLMAGNAGAFTRSSLKLGLAAFGTFAAAALGLGCGTASADVDEIAPSPNVTASQSQNSVIRINDFGVARGISETRLADAGVVTAQGEVRDTVRAVVGGTASAYEGEYPVGPPIADW